MSKGKLIVLMMALSLLFVGLVAGLEVKKSEIIVNTEPYQNLSFTVINPDTNEEIQVFTGRARKFGEYKFTYYGTINKISLSGSIVNNDTAEILKTEKFGPFNLGTSAIRLNLTLSEIIESVVVVDNSTNVTNSTVSLGSKQASGKSPIIGFVTGGDGKFSKAYYYVAAVALGLIILMIVLRRRTSTVKSPIEPNPKKMKTDKKLQSKTEAVVPQNATNKTSINETEKRISDLQKQLEQIRSEEKLLKLQKQINQEKESLKSMQDEYNPSTQNQQNNLDNKKPF